MKKMDKLDQINIYASSSLSNDDIQTLSLLYQPLIGANAIVAYEAMYSLLERNGFNSEVMCFYNITDILGISFDEFNNLRLKLEAIGLLETFVKSDSYVLLLKLPLTPNQFLVDSTLGIYLYSKIGENMFNMLTNHFMIEKFDRKGYKNITVSFDDVFESVNLNQDVKINGVVLGRKPNTNIQIKNHNFNFDDFLKLIDDSLLEFGVSNSFKKLIVNTSFVYGYDVDDLVLLYQRSINKNGYFDSKKFKNEAQTLYNNKNNMKAPLLGEKEKLQSEDEELMNTLANTTIMEMLSQFWPNYPDNYLKTINEIYDTIELERGVINILLFGILKDKNGELPTINYFKKAYNTWIELGITTKEAAWDYIRRPKNDFTTTKTPHKEGNVKTSDWVSKYKQNKKEGFETL